MQQCFKCQRRMIYTFSFKDGCSSGGQNFFGNSNFDYSEIRYNFPKQKLFHLFFLSMTNSIYIWKSLTHLYYNLWTNGLIYLHTWYDARTFSKYVTTLSANVGDLVILFNVWREVSRSDSRSCIATPPFNFEKCCSFAFVQNKEV